MDYALAEAARIGLAGRAAPNCAAPSYEDVQIGFSGASLDPYIFGFGRRNPLSTQI